MLEPSNLIFIAIAIAVFIVRTVAESKKKKKAPPPRKPQVEPLHFEVEKKTEEKTLAYAQTRLASDFIKDLAAKNSAGRSVAAPAPARKTGEKKSKKQAAEVKDSAVFKDTAAGYEGNAGSLPVSGQGPSPADSRKAQGQAGFAFNLNNLSPLKQAVVMAEILGPPKGMV